MNKLVNTTNPASLALPDVVLARMGTTVAADVTTCDAIEVVVLNVFRPVSPTLSRTRSMLVSFATFLIADVATREPLTMDLDTSLDPSMMDWLATRDPFASVWLAATEPFTTELPALTKPLPALRDVNATARDPVEREERRTEFFEDDFAEVSL